MKKYNGFMAAVTPTPHGPLFSTTGSIESPYVELAKKYLADHRHHWEVYAHPDETWLYEICCPEDPHIIPEKTGAHLLAIRQVATGKVVGRGFWGLWYRKRFGDVLPLMKKDKGEGFMVVDADSGEYLYKVKTPHYLALKFLARMTEKKVEALWDAPDGPLAKKVDEDFQFLVKRLTEAYTKEQWLVCGEQLRLSILRELAQ